MNISTKNSQNIKRNHSIGNFINTNSNNYDTTQVRPVSNLSKLSLLKKKHKQINNLIHIFSHKVNFDIQPLTQRQSLPPLNKKSIEGDNKLTRLKNQTLKNLKFILNKPKFSHEEEKLKAQKVKEVIRQNKENKRKIAKDTKETNRLMKENLIIFKEKQADENKQKCKIIGTKYEIIKDTIANYQILKRESIHEHIAEEIEDELKAIYEKQNELAFLKVSNENKQLKIKNNFLKYANKTTY